MSAHPAFLCGYNLTAIIVLLFRIPLKMFRLFYEENGDGSIFGYQIGIMIEEMAEMRMLQHCASWL